MSKKTPPANSGGICLRTKSSDNKRSIIEVDEPRTYEQSQTFYHDTGGVVLFSLLHDDVWKKDMLFCLFARKLIRIIAIDVGVPVERIKFGKWGAALEDYGDAKKYYKLIVNHPSYKAFRESLKVVTHGKQATEEEDELMFFINQYEALDFADYESGYGTKSYCKREAKKELKKKNFEKFKEAISW